MTVTITTHSVRGMKAVVVIPKRRELKVVDRPEPPPPESGQVLLQMREVGLCGTDREIAAFEYGEPPEGAEQLILGHESLAVIADVGPDVEQFKKGDLVVATVRRPCPHARCPACRTGRQDFCVTGDFRERGIKQVHGFMSERTVENASHLVRVPSALAEVGVLVEPLTIAAKASLQMSPIHQRLPWEPLNQRALVLGAGAIGLLGAMSLVLHGYRTFVYSLEKADSPSARIVESFGATYVSSQDEELRSLRERLGALDMIFEATGASHLAFTALELLGPNGSFVFTGIPGHSEPSPVDTDLLMRQIVLKNQLLFGTVNASRGAFDMAVRLLEGFLARFPDSVKGLISRRVTLDEVPDLLTSSQKEGIKTIVTFSS